MVDQVPCFSLRSQCQLGDEKRITGGRIHSIKLTFGLHLFLVGICVSDGIPKHQQLHLPEGLHFPSVDSISITVGVCETVTPVKDA